MYRCNRCGAEFEEPRVYYEMHDLPYPPYEQWQVCPCCMDTDIEEELDFV